MTDKGWNETLREALDKWNSTTGSSVSISSPPPEMKGWICPVCGRGLSPYTAVCPCKNGNGWVITC